MIDRILVKRDQDIGEVMGWDGDNVWVLFSGNTETVEVPIDELTVIHGNTRFQAIRGRKTSSMSESRPLDKQERILARHLLQELSEHAKAVRNVMDPLHGMHTITVEAWCDQWKALTRELDYFTDRCADA